MSDPYGCVICDYYHSKTSRMQGDKYHFCENYTYWYKNLERVCKTNLYKHIEYTVDIDGDIKTLEMYVPFDRNYFYNTEMYCLTVAIFNNNGMEHIYFIPNKT